MLLPVKNMAGDQVGEFELDDSVFAAPIRRGLMHQALVRQLANARQGTHNTKRRGEVAGGGRKPWRQKGTGRARQGSTRSPQWVGGGVVFGPHPRQYTKQMPKKMHRAALRSALTVKADAGQIVLVDELNQETPNTKAFLRVLDALGIAEQRSLVVMAEKNERIQRSANNLPHVKTLLSGYINIRDFLGSDIIVMETAAATAIVDWLGVDADEAIEPVGADESVEE